MTITTTGEPKDLATLYGKIAAVTAAMKRVPKNGTNKFQGYQYATESDIVDTLREAMAEAKIAIIPSVDSTERIEHKNEKLGPITRLFMTFTVACGNTGATIQLPWIGDGQDTADKGLYKAYTGAEKYFLMKLFLVATGDDPEQDTEPQSRPQPRQQQPPRQIAPPDDVKRQKAMDRIGVLVGEFQTMVPEYIPEPFHTFAFDNLMAYGGRLRAWIDKASRGVTERAPTILEQQAAITEKETDFWARWGGFVGGTSWEHISREIGPVGIPTSDEEWQALDARMNAHANAATKE